MLCCLKCSLTSFLHSPALTLVDTTLNKVLNLSVLTFSSVKGANIPTSQVIVLVIILNNIHEVLIQGLAQYKCSIGVNLTLRTIFTRLQELGVLYNCSLLPPGDDF